MSVLDVEDLVFTIVGMLDADGYQLLKHVNLCFCRTIQRHFSFHLAPLEYYCQSVNMLRWTIEEGGCPSMLYRRKSILYGAAWGSIDVIAWCRGQETPFEWDAEVCNKAATGGHLAVLQWLRAQQPPCPWNAMTCGDAASGGHLTVLQWLRAHEPPCPWNRYSCRMAALNGFIHLLKTRREQTSPRRERHVVASCAATASSDHLAMLQWLGR